MINGIHHVAIIVSDYERSKKFYTDILGFKIISEHFRTERNSYKLDLSINDHYKIELFSFPNSPKRVSRPEACGLRHLALSVTDLDLAIANLTSKGIATETIRIDEFTGKRFTFFQDPDQLPIELYEL